SASSSSTTRGGRGRLPVWVVRMRSVLRSMASSGRLGFSAREEVDEDLRHLRLLGRPVLGRDEIDIDIAGEEIVELAPRDHAMRCRGDGMAVGLVVAGDDAGRHLDRVEVALARADDR